MPPGAAAAFSSSLCFSSVTPSSSNDHTHHVQASSLSPKPKTALQKHPLYTSTHNNLSIQFKEKILCLELLGVDSGKALSHNPSLQSASLESIHRIITFLYSKGLHQNDLRRIFGMCPKILTSDVKTDLDPVFHFLSNEVNVPEQSFRKVVNKCPRLLVSSVENQLKLALSYLRSLGFKDMKAVAYNEPVLLVSNVENAMMPKLDFLISLGFDRHDAECMVLRCPSLLTFSIENNYKPKFEYYMGEMLGDLKGLIEFPQYFAFSLEKRIKVRHAAIVHAGVEMPLGVMLKATDDEFREFLVRERLRALAASTYSLTDEKKVVMPHLSGTTCDGSLLIG